MPIIKYVWRNNVKAIFSNNKLKVRGKLAFKTKCIQWIETEKPVIVLVSVYSAFHHPVDGDLKMNALMSTIKTHVKGKITVLLADSAHMQVHSLQHRSPEIAFHDCVANAKKLNQRYETYFEGCQVAYWHSYISKDENYLASIESLRKLAESNEAFGKLLHLDAQSTYTAEQQLRFPDRDLFIEKAIEDILCQCACVLVLARKKYRFQFYPGCPYTSVHYISKSFLPVEQTIAWVNVFLAIEKKTYCEQND